MYHNFAMSCLLTLHLRTAYGLRYTAGRYSCIRFNQKIAPRAMPRSGRGVRGHTAQHRLVSCSYFVLVYSCFAYFLSLVRTLARLGRAAA